jgi:SAM-dependent methyltransferase
MIAPAAERNKQPILEVLERVLPPGGTVLEIASGTGQHVVHFARAMTGLRWQPSDANVDARSSIAARIAGEKLSNVDAPVELDARHWPWPLRRADAILCINMIHIAPWAAAEGLMRGAGELLPEDGVLVLYGPYRRFGAHTAPSNEAFDAGLRAQDPEWGVRDLEAVERLAEAYGLSLEQVVSMPTNNFTLVFRKGAQLSST